MSDATVTEEKKDEAATEAAQPEQAPLFPDEIKEEEDVREVLVRMQPHEMIEAFQGIFDLHREVKDLQAQEEAEKTRHKEEKDRIAAALETAEMKRSQRLDQAETGMRRELKNTIKRTNYTTKMVSWHDRETGEKYDERPMVAAEHQVKLAFPDNVVPIDQGADAAPEDDGEAGGVDPATMDEVNQQGADGEGAPIDPSEPEDSDE